MRRLLLVIIFVFGSSLLGHSTTVQIVGTLKDSSGTTVNGSGCFRLPVNAIDTSTNTALSPRTICFTLANGTFPAFATVVPNDVIQPANTFYQFVAYNTSRAPVFMANYGIPTGAGTFNLGLAIPTSITTSNISYTGIGFLALSNAWTGAESHSGAETFSGPTSFTGAPPANLYVTTGGSDANPCTLASPCLTVQRCGVVALSYNWGGSNQITCNIGSGTFSGPIVLTGPIAGDNNTVSVGYLIFKGNGSANTTVTNAGGGQVGVFTPTSGIYIAIRDMNVSVPSGETGVFAEAWAQVQLIGTDLLFTGQAGAIAPLHEEGMSFIQQSAGQTMTLNGTFSYFMTAGPGGQGSFSGTITCGTLTTFGSTYVLLDQASTIAFASGLSYSGCGAVTGLRYSVKGNSFLLNTSGLTLLGNSIGIVDSGGRFRPSPTMTINGSPSGLGTGGTATVDAGSGSHGGYITLNTGSAATGASGTVTINWGENQIITGSSVQAPCTVSNQNGATGWVNGATAWVAANSNVSMQLAWVNSATVLATGTTYKLAYTCNGDI